MPHKINLLDLRYLRELLTNINVVALFALLFHPNSGLGYTPNGQIFQDILYKQSKGRQSDLLSCERKA